MTVDVLWTSSKTIGLDAVVGSVGNGSTLRLSSDIPGVKYTEGRFLACSCENSRALDRAILWDAHGEENPHK